MAQPKTQYNIKVFKSSVEKFQNFMGNVDKPSSSKNMQIIYDNMTMLFDVFTQGALMEQGANAEILMRTIYRTLNEDFLKIVQDTDAAKKIAQVLKEKQASLTPENVDKAMVSDTTKKVVTKSLDPNDCDPGQVILDFTDELQTAILQVKLNLSREYEQQKLAYAKSKEGQNEDIERLNKELVEQSQQTMDALGQMQEEDKKWSDEQLNKTREMMDKFDIKPEDVESKDENGISKLEQIAEQLKTLGQDIKKLKDKAKFNPNKIVEKLKSVPQKQEQPQETPQKQEPKEESQTQESQSPKETPKEQPEKKPPEKAEPPKQEEPKKQPPEKPKEEPAESPKQQEQTPQKEAEPQKKEPPKPQETEQKPEEPPKPESPEPPKEEAKQEQQKPAPEKPAPEQSSPEKPVQEQEAAEPVAQTQPEGEAATVETSTPAEETAPVEAPPVETPTPQKGPAESIEQKGKDIVDKGEELLEKVKKIKEKLQDFNAKRENGEIELEQGGEAGEEQETPTEQPTQEQSASETESQPFPPEQSVKVPEKQLPEPLQPAKMNQVDTGSSFVVDLDEEAKRKEREAEAKRRKEDEEQQKKAEEQKKKEDEEQRAKQEEEEKEEKGQKKETPRKAEEGQEESQEGQPKKETPAVEGEETQKKQETEETPAETASTPEKLTEEVEGEMGTGETPSEGVAQPVPEAPPPMQPSVGQSLTKPPTFEFSGEVATPPSPPSESVGTDYEKADKDNQAAVEKKEGEERQEQLEKTEAQVDAEATGAEIKGEVDSMAQTAAGSVSGGAAPGAEGAPGAEAAPSPGAEAAPSPEDAPSGEASPGAGGEQPSGETGEPAQQGQEQGGHQNSGDMAGSLDAAKQQTSTAIENAGEKDERTEDQKRVDEQKEASESGEQPSGGEGQPQSQQQRDENENKTDDEKAAEMEEQTNKQIDKDTGKKEGEAKEEEEDRREEEDEEAEKDKEKEEEDAEKKKDDEGSKLKVKPDLLQDYVCPKCGTPYTPNAGQKGGGAARDAQQGAAGAGNQPGTGTQLNQQPQPMQNPLGGGQEGGGNGEGGENGEGEDPGDKISKKKVNRTLKKIHENVCDLVEKPRFRKNFMLNFKSIQKSISKQMNKADEDEQDINKNLKKTQAGIKDLKDDQDSGGFLTGMLFGGLLYGLVFVAVGALLLITAARMLWQHLIDKYYPDDETYDGETLTVFGIPIPYWDKIKSAGVFVWNIITIAIPNAWDTLMMYFHSMWNSLFGRRGYWKDWTEVRHTWRRLKDAWLVGQYKKIGGWAWNLIVPLLGMIPGVGTIAMIVLHLLPDIAVFIYNKINGAYNDKLHEIDLEDARRKAALAMTPDKLKDTVNQASSKLKTFTPFKNIGGFEMTDKEKESVGYFTKVNHGAIIRSQKIMTVNATENRQDQFKQYYAKFAIGEEAKKAYRAREKPQLRSTDENTFFGKLNVSHIKMTSQTSNDDEKKKAKDNIGTLISAEKRKLIKYILEQKKSLDAFTERNANLLAFDPDKGWNPALAVTSDMLKSKLGFGLFSTVSQTAKYELGKEAASGPYGKEPYLWVWNGIPIYVPPQAFEIARAGRRYELWGQLEKAILNNTAPGRTALFDDKNILGLIDEWNETNSPRVFDYKNSVVAGRLQYFNFGEVPMIAASVEKWKQMIVNTSLLGKNELSGQAFTQIAIFQNESQRLSGLFPNDSKWVGDIDAIEKGNRRYLRDAIFQPNTMYREKGEEEEKAPPPRFGATQKDGKWVDDEKSIFSTLPGYDARKILLSKWEYEDWSDQKRAMYANVDEITDFFGKAKNLLTPNLGVIDQPLIKAEVLLHNLFSLASTIGIKQVKLPNYMDKFEAVNMQFKNLRQFIDLYMSRRQIKADNIGPSNWRLIETGFANSILEYFYFFVLPQWNKYLYTVADVNAYTEEISDEYGKVVDMLDNQQIMQHVDKHVKFGKIHVKIIDYDDINSLPVKGEQVEKDLERSGLRSLLDTYRTKLGIENELERKLTLAILDGVLESNDQKTNDEKNDVLVDLLKKMKPAAYEAKYTGDYSYFWKLMDYYKRIKAKFEVDGWKPDGNKLVKIIQMPKTSRPVSTDEELQEREKEREGKRQQLRMKEEAERKKKLELQKKRAEEIAKKEAIARHEAQLRQEEQNYEQILEKMIADPSSVSDDELKSLKGEVEKLKQEAENNIWKMPRKERDKRLQLIRGDKVSEKTFDEVKKSATGLHDSLQNYMSWVNKIPTGSIASLQNVVNNTGQPVAAQNNEAVDLASA